MKKVVYGYLTFHPDGEPNVVTFTPGVQVVDDATKWQAVPAIMNHPCKVVYEMPRTLRRRK